MTISDNYSNHTFEVSRWGGLLSQCMTVLTASFYPCRESGKRGRETPKPKTQNRRVRSVFLLTVFICFCFIMHKTKEKTSAFSHGAQNCIFLVYYCFFFLQEFCRSQSLTNFYPCFYTSTSSLWGSVLIVAGMSAVVQPNDHCELPKIRELFTLQCTL